MIEFQHLVRGLDLGYLPGFLSENDPRPAREQIDQNYSHGGGWDAMPGWVYKPMRHTITYPGDATLSPLAFAVLRDETLYFYKHSWLAIVQKDGSYEVGRVD